MSWNIGGGGQASEDVFLFGGKTLNFSKPREKFTISFEVIINNSDFDFVHFGSTFANSAIGNMAAKTVKSTDPQKEWRVAFWFQEAQYHIANTNKTVIVPGKDNDIYRMICVNVKSVTFDKEFAADDYFKGTLNLEFSSSDSNGFANYIQNEGIYNGTTATQLVSVTTTATNGLLLEARGYLDWNTTAPAWHAGATTSATDKRYKYTG